MDISGIMESPTQRLRALMAARLKKMDERRFANRVCSELLAALNAMRSAQAELKGDDLYEAVIAKRSSLDAAQARAIVWRAHESLEDWGNDRDPKFIDVAKYVIVSEYLGKEVLEDGMSIDLGEFLSRRIDPQL